MGLEVSPLNGRRARGCTKARRKQTALAYARGRQKTHEAVRLSLDDDIRALPSRASHRSHVHANAFPRPPTANTIAPYAALLLNLAAQSSGSSRSTVRICQNQVRGAPATPA